MSGENNEASSLEDIEFLARLAAFSVNAQGSPPHAILRRQGDQARRRYQAQGRLQDLDIFVNSYRLAVEVVPKDDPERLAILSNFGVALTMRFEHLGNPADLEESFTIRKLSHSLTPETSTDKPAQLLNLAVSYKKRFEVYGKLHDLEEAIQLDNRVLELIPEDHQYRLGMMNDLGSSLLSHYDHTGDRGHLEKAIALQSQVITLMPESHPFKPFLRSNYGNSLQERFRLDGSVDDLEQAVALQTHAVNTTPDSHAGKSLQMTCLGSTLLRRFQWLGNVEDLENTITLFEDALRLTPDGHPDESLQRHNLAGALTRRFERKANPEDLERAIILETRAVDLTPKDHPETQSRLKNLGAQLHRRFEQSGSRADLDEAIKCFSNAVGLSQDGHKDKPSTLHNLAHSLLLRFEVTGDPNDLAEAIGFSTQSLKLLPEGNPEAAGYRRLLSRLYLTRFLSPHAVPEDLKNAIDALTTAIQQPSALPVERLWASRAYISSLRAASVRASSPKITLLQAHEHIVGLLPQVAWLGNSARRRYEELLEWGSLVSEAASDAIAAGEHALALEWLESGRAIVWSQVLQLRTPLDDLQCVDSALANELRHVSQMLRNSATSGSEPVSLSPRSSSTQPPLEAQAQSFHAYAARYEKLLGRIRELDNFQDFLRPKKLSQLGGACSSGPVVVVNVHQSRCDALVLSSPGNVTHIPLPGLSYGGAVDLQIRLKKCLKANHVLGSLRGDFGLTRDDEGYYRGGRVTERDATGWMYGILADLWRTVVEPITTAIKDLSSSPAGEAETPLHITWCPTGPLTFLPLHAAGIYPKPGKSEADLKCIMDIAISSYTPTLEALLKPRNRAASSTGSSEYPHVLIVSQPAIPGFSPISATTEEAGIVMSLVESSTALHDTNGTVHAVIEGMASHPWAHLACHGIQRSDDPTKSSFALYDGALTLEQLMSQSIPNADLAVLSACQTATGDEKLSEEAVHLAAGMLSIGYKSVIGTMWSIDDYSAPTIMARFSEVVTGQIKAGEELRPAYALHEATKALREKYGVTDFVRWVPFVHFGL